MAGEYDSEELKIRRTKKLSIIGMCIGILIVAASLIYEFIYKAEEGITGMIIGIVAILISVQFYTTMDIKESMREVKEGVREKIMEVRDETRGAREDIREAREVILEKLK
jgi:uncharacterized membrane protein